MTATDNSRIGPHLLCLSVLLLLAGCGGAKSDGGSNVTLRDMEVVDGTANDAMVDLDNASTDGTSLANASIPAAASNAATATGSTPDSNSSAATPAAPPADSPPKATTAEPVRKPDKTRTDKTETKKTSAPQ